MAQGNQRKMIGLADMSDTKKLEWRRKFLVFSFFLTVSVLIWLLNALSKNYTTKIDYPITFSKFPEGKLLISDVPDDLELKVNAHGYALLSYNLTNRPIPLNFPVSSFSMNRSQRDSTRSYLLTRFTRDQVRRQLPSDLELLEIYPDTLYFQFANKVVKQVPVIPNVEYELARSFTLMEDIRVEPDSLLITGPDIYLDTLDQIVTVHSNLGELNKSYTGSLEIGSSKGLTFSTQKINLFVELEKLTEVQLEVPVQLEGFPDSLIIQTFPQMIKISGRVGLSSYDRIVPEAFYAVVSYQDVLNGRSMLNVKMKTVPSELKNLDFYPKSIEYLLTVK